MSETKKTKTREEEDRELFIELCTNNGINNAAQEGPSVQLVEMFFSGYPRIIGMHHFPNLQCLCIIGQSIQRVDGVMCLTKLKELWIAECQLKKIEGLSEMKQLQKLYLYANQIEKIENLDCLKQLEVIWLNCNKIKNIDGLTNLRKLMEVNLAENQIQKLGHSLDNLVKLENLNLSGNKLYSFKDITSLVRLPKLTFLGLKDINFAPSPVAMLCNYSTHVLYHLPGLVRLDTYDVSSKQLKTAAEGTVMKKKMYYTMRMKTVRRKQADQLVTLKKARDEVYYKHPHERIRTLWFGIKEIDRELVDMKQRSGRINDGHESGTESDKDARAMEVEKEQNVSAKLEHKQEALRQRMNHWEEKCDEIDFYYTEAISKVRQMADTEVIRLTTELETGGNVRFEDGKSTDVWFTSCHDLILSRFCAVDYKEFGIQGIKIHRITRVHNRILRTRFDDKLSSMLDDDDSYLPSTRSGSHKKLIEYLFWMWDPELPGGTSEPARVLEEGFLDSDTYRQLGKDAAVPLTNSLSLADKMRIDHLKKIARSKPYKDSCPFRHGQVVVCKVYLGRNSQALDTKIQKGHYPKADSVFKPRKNTGKASPKSEALHGQTCECSTRQCEWFIFDHELVVPEYVIDFEYITRVKPTHPFSSIDVEEPESKSTVPVDGDSNVDTDVLMMEPIIKQRPRFITITDELVLKVTNCDNLVNVTELNLHGNGLNRLRNLTNMPNLKKLIVSFNELTKLDDIAHLTLEYVDASFNKIVTLEGMKNMSKLKFLDLSWNQLFSTREELAIIRKHCPSLAQLDIRQNQWQKPDGLRLRAIGRLKALTVLDGIPVTESEATAALRMAAGSRISQVSLLTHSRTDTVRPRSLNLSPCALVLSQSSRLKPDRLGEQDNEWYAKVTSLNLDGQHISKLSNLEKLENLKWASFNDNDLTRIEGLDSCSNLEELCLENNCLTKIEGLAKLTKLQKLMLGHNYISSLENVGLDKMSELAFLSVENNRLTSLGGTQRITGLMELYVGNNQISNPRDIFYLKNLSNFLILDMYGNPVVKETDNYRLFVIYHLKPLKALDGLAIEASEASQAKDSYGGRLTLDFVAEKVGHSNFNEVREIDFPNASIRTVDLGNGQYFHSLRSVNLEHNNLSSFSGLIYLVNLRVLCLNHNHVECIVPRPKPQASVKSRTTMNSNVENAAPSQDLYSPESYTPILENLEVLHLGYNGIKNLVDLQVSRLTGLKALFLQGNEITKVEGLEGLQDLRELVLDRNKIKSVTEFSFMNQWNLQELHMEENRVKELDGLTLLENLQRLYLGMNRIQDISELEKLECLPNLIELSVVSNAVARRLIHRPMLVFRMPNLMIIDGIPVSDEERAKAELYFMDQQPPQMTTTIEATLPGIGQYKTSIPVKVTNVQLASPDRSSWSGTIQYSDEPVAYDSRARRRNNQQNAVTTVPSAISLASRTASSTYPMSSSNQTASSGQPKNGGTFGYQYGQQDYMSHGESLARLMSKSNRRL